MEETPRRVRGLFDQRWVFDTTHAWHVWEHPYYPLYYVPLEAINAGMLIRGNPEGEGPSSGILKGANKSTDKILIFEKGPLSGLVRIEMEALGKS